MKKKEQAINETKQKILDISARLFAEQGFDNTGIDEIAREVGIAKSVIYYHFKNKKEILDTLFSGFFEDYAKSKLEAMNTFKNGASEDKIGELYRLMADWIPKIKSSMPKILLMESVKHSGDIPLFKFWEIYLDILNQYQGAELNALPEDKKKDILFESFFMMGMPTIGFFVFLESFSKHYGMPEEELIKKMIAISELYFREIWSKRIWESN